MPLQSLTEKTNFQKSKKWKTNFPKAKGIKLEMPRKNLENLKA